MGGGLMQLVAYGAQDIYLTGNPQITFFKVVYRRHTNFSMESIQQTWNGNSTTNGRCTATISRNGDLINKMYIELSADHINGAIDNPGARYIEDIEIEIGGQSIDKQSGLWMECVAELTEPNPTGRITVKFAGNYDQQSVVHDDTYKGTSFQGMSAMGGYNASTTGVCPADGPLFIPLRFWFCRHPGLSLPLIALQYHEVKVILNHQISSVFVDNISQKLYVDYIYLDTDERRRFAQVSHEYLIEQVQYHNISSLQPDLRFNHPVKELIWCRSDKLSGDQNASLTTSDNGYLLKLNGHDRFSVRPVYYFTRQQIYDYHTGPGGLGLEEDPKAYGIFGISGAQNDSIAVYSFALKPEEHQPSGTCNFSRIDSAQLLGLPTDTYTIFAINYNVLRIMSGMGGLAYSN